MSLQPFQQRWLASLQFERLYSSQTCEAYARDVAQFFAFYATKLLKLEDFFALRPADIRAFLHARRQEGIGNRSVLRQLAGLRSFARFLEREGLGSSTVFHNLKGPRAPKTLPRPLTAADACALTQEASLDDGRQPAWIRARDAAVFALLYGAGLRISEALSLRRKEAPLIAGEPLTILGKGKKTRQVPILPQVAALIGVYIKLCPYSLALEGALFLGAKGGGAFPAYHPITNGENARRLRPTRKRNAARFAPFFRHAFIGERG